MSAYNKYMLKLIIRISGLLSIISLFLPLSTYAYTFTQLLQKGFANSEVRELQQTLKNDSLIYPEGLVTGYFGSLTEKAVQRFQAKYGVINYGTPATTGYGLVGKRTRAKLNEVFDNPNTYNSQSNLISPVPTSISFVPTFTPVYEPPFSTSFPSISKA